MTKYYIVLMMKEQNYVGFIAEKKACFPVIGPSSSRGPPLIQSQASVPLNTLYGPISKYGNSGGETQKVTQIPAEDPLPPLGPLSLTLYSLLLQI